MLKTCQSPIPTANLYRITDITEFVAKICSSCHLSNVYFYNRYICSPLASVANWPRGCEALFYFSWYWFDSFISQSHISRTCKRSCRLSVRYIQTHRSDLRYTWVPGSYEKFFLQVGEVRKKCGRSSQTFSHQVAQKGFWSWLALIFLVFKSCAKNIIFPAGDD